VIARTGFDSSGPIVPTPGTPPLSRHATNATVPHPTNSDRRVVPMSFNGDAFAEEMDAEFVASGRVTHPTRRFAIQSKFAYEFVAC